MIKKCCMMIVIFVALIQCRLSFAKPVDVRDCPSNIELLIAPELGEDLIIDAIHQAKISINLAMYLFTDKKIAAALADAAARGVQVHALVERAPYTFEQANQWLADYWRDSKVVLHWSPPASGAFNFLHEKIMIIDHHQIWMMTLNFTRSSFSKNEIERNFILLDNNLAEVQNLEAVFEKDWVEQAVSLSLIEDNALIVLSPLNTEKQLNHLITEAHTQIKIYAEGLDDYAFIGNLAKAAAQGVSVQVIYGGQLRDEVKHYLLENGVQLQSPHCFMNHAKAIVVDNAFSYVGSANFTHNSFIHNREAGFVVQDGCIARQLSKQFDQDFACHHSLTHLS